MRRIPSALAVLAAVAVAVGLVTPSVAPSLPGPSAVPSRALVAGSGARPDAIAALHAPHWAAWASTNWSGYVVQRLGVRSVAGSWVVPSVARTSAPSFSATWIGIGGFSERQLVQIGTEQDSAGGIVSYSAWWEILPYPQQIIGLSISPGDRMRATVASTPAGWRLTLRNITTGRGFSTVVGRGGSGRSAEWIEEPPMTPWGLSTLADYRTVTFDDGLVNGVNPRLVASQAGRIVRAGVVRSMPSAPDTTTDGFTVRYGSTVPPAPRG